jgi:hypothetical protein
MEHNARRCCVCGEPVSQEEVVLHGYGGHWGNAARLYVHTTRCTQLVLRYLNERATSARPRDEGSSGPAIAG